MVHQAGHVDTPAGTSCDPAPEEEIPLESRLLKEASSLGKFHGTESPEIAEHWIDMACYYQATFACDDDRLKVMLVGMRLRDVAAKWFVGLKHARVPWGSPAAFRAAFLKRFCPQAKSFTQKGNQYQTSQTSGHKRPMEHAKGPSPKRAASWPTKVEDFGPPNERNKKFPHITNAEAFRRIQHNLCCFCGDAGHAARQCRAEAHDNRELRK